MDALTPEWLMSQLGLDPNDPFLLYPLGQVPVEWVGGTLGVEGIQGLEAAPRWDALGFSPLPGPPRKARMLSDPRTGEPVYQLEYDGEYVFPPGLVLTIPRHAPWTFRVHNDWRVELSGDVEIQLPNSGTLTGSVSWRNGAISLALTAHALNLETLGSLRELMAGDPTALLPASADDTAMDAAAAGLEAYRLSHRHARGVGLAALGDARRGPRALPGHERGKRLAGCNRKRLGKRPRRV